MLDRSRALVRYLCRRDVAARSLRTFPDDTFIVSYPKSGNTWVLFLVANLIKPDRPATFLTVDRIIPAVHRQSRHYFKSLPRPRIIKSHYPFDPSYKRVIYLVRDPRDVVISQYHYQLKRRHIADGYPIDRYVSRFIAGDVCPYGSWAEHVGSWAAARHSHPGFLLVRYEDLLAQGAERLAGIASFLHLERTPLQLDEALKRSAADRMRHVERAEASKWDLTRGSRKDISFVRSAKAGGWRSDLPAHCVAAIEAAWGPWMQWLGYELACGQEQESFNSILLNAPPPWLSFPLARA